ncbi:U1 small nuclear ribonucleoprotein C [[Candida] anglica]|uniref:U1 small nuclear ribonucleoprotein C n=1 Tax=[Candida] anglica TaxID=148631 RepID=A0ABP0EBS3_9ASCO
MPKYYCDYCKSYLTHDTMSVRKSHLMGRNHIKYYCDYYEQKAKQTGIWTPSELPYEIDTSYLNQGAPGVRVPKEKSSKKSNIPADVYSAQKNFSLPPPPNLPTFPNPPPSILREAEEVKESIALHKRKDTENTWY